MRPRWGVGRRSLALLAVAAVAAGGAARAEPLDLAVTCDTPLASTVTETEPS